MSENFPNFPELLRCLLSSQHLKHKRKQPEITGNKAKQQIIVFEKLEAEDSISLLKYLLIIDRSASP